jgi:hypothetical protein
MKFYLFQIAIIICVFISSCDKEDTKPNIEIGSVHMGGIIFYIDETGQHGLVSTIEDVGSYDWGCYTYNVNGADSLAIGTGFQNTIDILNENCTSQFLNSTASQISSEYVQNELNDWFLPSFNELNEMYLSIGPGSNIGNVGDFSNSPYWSSSEVNAWYAWTVSFGNGGILQSNKNAVYNVRPIRSF